MQLFEINNHTIVVVDKRNTNLLLVAVCQDLIARPPTSRQQQYRVFFFCFTQVNQVSLHSLPARTMDNQASVEHVCVHLKHTSICCPMAFGNYGTAGALQSGSATLIYREVRKRGTTPSPPPSTRSH